MAGFLVNLDAQADPLPVLFVFVLVCLVLTLLVTSLRKRDERREAAGRTKRRSRRQ